MIRSNPNIPHTAHFSFLKTDAYQSADLLVKMEQNLLAIINILLAFKKPDKPLKWLNFGNNSVKLIKFIITVCDNYDELTADYTILKVDQNQIQEALADK